MPYPLIDVAGKYQSPMGKVKVEPSEVARSEPSVYQSPMGKVKLLIRRMKQC